MRNLYPPYSLHTRGRRHGRNASKPEPERNIPAAFFSLVVSGIFAVAMAEPKWMKIHGGKCNNMAIGLYKIFGVGRYSSPANLKGIFKIALKFHGNRNIDVVYELKVTYILMS